MTAWTDADSADLDQEVKRLRRAEQAERAAPQERHPRTGVQTSDYLPGVPRGSATGAELQRRTRMDKHMKGDI